MDVSSEASRQALLMRIHGRLCIIPLANVSEVLRPLPIEVIAGRTPALLGMAIHRGVPVPVLDVSPLIGLGDRGSRGRFVALRVGDRATLLAVDEVLGTRDLSEAALRELPSLLGEAGQETLAQIGRLDDELLLVLRAARFVQDDVWVSQKASAD